MHKKYIFLDLDGTVIDHSNEEVPESAKKAIQMAQENGHEIIINTGRPPCLLYGIDKELKIESFVAANGRYAVHKGDVILNMVIDKSIVERIVQYAEENRIDLGFEGLHFFKRQSSYSDLYEKFSENFHLEIPELDTEYYKSNDIYQMTLYYSNDDWEKFKEIFPEVTFAYSCAYGIDVNSKGGLKEVGIQAFIEKYDISMKDVIAIGDGHNDISMFNFVETSVAMGNAQEEVKAHTTHVTDDVSKNGLYHLKFLFHIATQLFYLI